MTENLATHNRKPARPVRFFRGIAGGWTVLRNNPIILKELRQRMRSWHGLGALALAMLALSIFALLVYGSLSTNYGTYRNGYLTYDARPRSQETGTSFFLAIVIGQIFLACVLSPGFGAGAIAGEKERQTYEVLLVTLLRPRDIIIGKLFSSLAYIMLLIVAGVPVISIAFLMGGVGPDQLIAATVVMVLTGVMFGAIGIYWSSLMRSSRWAGGNAFVNILVLFFGVPFGLVIGLFIFVRNYFSGNFPLFAETFSRDVLVWLLSVNPMYVIIGTNEILRQKAGSNILYFANEPGDFILTPFSRFIILAIVITFVYIRLAAKRIKPLTSKAEKKAEKAASRKRATLSESQG